MTFIDLSCYFKVLRLIVLVYKRFLNYTMSENNSEDLKAFTVVDETDENLELNGSGEGVDEGLGAGDVNGDPCAGDADEDIGAEGVNEDQDAEGVDEDLGATIEDTDEEDKEQDAEMEDEQESNSSNGEFVVQTNMPESEHPYLDLIDSFEYPEEQITITPLDPIRPVSETPLQLIETKASLIKLLQTLRNVKEIAVDLVPNTKSSNTNIQVMAVSTRETDYIIDVLKLKNEIRLLTEIFINPKIVKIFFSKATAHTMACLQHNLCLYVVNLFDLNKVVAALFGEKFPSFKVILKRDYSVSEDLFKPPAMEERPIKEEDLEYCRIKTHFLIHLYHDYKNRLLTKDEQLYMNVLQQCRDASKNLHCDRRQKELQQLEQAMQNRHKAELVFLKKMFAWKTNTAKEMDKNPNEIMDKTTILRFASHLPIDKISVNFLTQSEDVRKASKEIVNVVKQITAEYKPEYTTLAMRKASWIPRADYIKKMMQNNNLNRINKQAKFGKIPNTFNQAKRQTTSKNERLAFKPNKSSQRGFSNLNIPPFLSQSTSSSTNSNFLPVMGTTGFQQTNFYNPPFQARFQNSTGDYNNGSNIMGNSLRNTGGYNPGSDNDYTDNRMMESSANNSNFNRGRSGYLNNRGQKWNRFHFQKRNNDGYRNFRNTWHN